MNEPVLIVIGSDSDFRVMSSCVKTLREFDVASRLRVCSAHRTPELAAQLAREAAEAGVRVVIAAAGLAAHLPGVLAAQTTLPVIGVPISGGALNGQDALYSIAQMPPGVPVATMAIDGAQNAAIMAVQILATAEPELRQKLMDYKSRLAASAALRQERVDQALSELS